MSVLLEEIYMDLKKRNEDMREFFNSKAEGYDNVHMRMILNKE